MRLKALLITFAVLACILGIEFAAGLFTQPAGPKAPVPQTVNAATDIPCPNKEHALYTVTAPGKWKVTPPSTAGDYITFESPDGVMLYFRHAPGQLDKVMEEARAEINDSYKSIVMSEPKPLKVGGLEATEIAGTGIDADDKKSKMAFSLVWVTLPGGQIAEFWSETDADDTEGLPLAANVRETLKVVDTDTAPKSSL